MLLHLVRTSDITDIRNRLANHPKELHTAISNHGESVLMIAVKSRPVEIVKLLLEYGANVNFKDRYNVTSLMEAMIYHNEDKKKIVKLLLDYDANVNAQTPSGYTSLALDIEYGCNLTEILLEYNADPNIRMPSGKSVIDLLNSAFMYSDRKNVVRNLLANCDGNNKSKILNSKN